LLPSPSSTTPTSAINSSSSEQVLGSVWIWIWVWRFIESGSISIEGRIIPSCRKNPRYRYCTISHASSSQWTHSPRSSSIKSWHDITSFYFYKGFLFCTSIIFFLYYFILYWLQISLLLFLWLYRRICDFHRDFFWRFSEKALLFLMNIYS